eukprot:scaffold190670_cov49-Attheya_sp.AAC.1
MAAPASGHWTFGIIVGYGLAGCRFIIVDNKWYGTQTSCHQDNYSDESPYCAYNSDSRSCTCDRSVGSGHFYQPFKCLDCVVDAKELHGLRDQQSLPERKK